MGSRRDELARVLPGAVSSGPRERKALHKLIDKWFGEDAEDCVAALAGIIKGTDQVKARAQGKNEDAVSYALVPEVPPTISQKLEAINLVMQYRHGKPKESIEHSGVIDTGPQPGKLDYSRLTDGELARLEELSQKALAGSQTALAERGIITVQPEAKGTTP